MYVTRPLSRYLSDPSAAAEAPPEGPGSGFLVVVDETGETARTRFWGLCVDRRMRGLPFPQNRQLALKPNNNPDALESTAMLVDFTSEVVVGVVLGLQGGRAPGSRVNKLPDYAMLVPVVGQPLSSGRYYVLKVEGKHRGKVSACSKEGDRSTSWFSSGVKDAKPQAFDRRDVYQQVEVQRLPYEGFQAVSVAADGIPPSYLRKKGWKVDTIMFPKYDLRDDAQGVDSALRRRMPDHLEGPAVVVGRWYVPFMFVKADGERSVKDQFRRCTFYEMTMEQAWEQIYSRDNDNPAAGTTAEVAVAATVRRSTAALLGGTCSAVREADGETMWFRPAAAWAARTATVGLDMVVWERMRWELERGGWVNGNGNGGQEEERIERVERPREGWHKFGGYVLVERFVLKRTDGTIALTCDFRHTNKIMCIILN